MCKNMINRNSISGRFIFLFLIVIGCQSTHLDKTHSSLWENLVIIESSDDLIQDYRWYKCARRIERDTIILLENLKSDCKVEKYLYLLNDSERNNIFSFRNGTGSLYINGELVFSDRSPSYLLRCKDDHPISSPSSEISD